MVVKLQRPILVGGLGLSLALWILDSWHNSLIQVGEFGLLSALAVGGGLWLFQKNRPKTSLEQLSGIVVDQAIVTKAIAQIETIINQLAQETENHPALAGLREQVAKLWLELDRQELKLAVTGGKSVGKSTVIEVLQKNVETLNFKSLQLVETRALFSEIGNKSDVEIFAQMQTSDFVLFLTNGDLTDSEFQVIQQLKAENLPTLLVFNKQDQYLSDERISILQSLKQRMEGNAVATDCFTSPGQSPETYG